LFDFVQDRLNSVRSHTIFGRPFVKRFALCYRTVVLSVLSVTLVHCGQTVGWIKMKLGIQVGLGLDHTVLDGDPALPPQRGSFPPFTAPANICCGQMAAWIKMPLNMEVGLSPATLYLMGTPLPLPPKTGGAPKFSAHVYCGQMAAWIKMPLGTEGGIVLDEICVRWRSNSPFPKRGRSPLPIFVPCLLWPNGWMHQDTTWYGGRPQPRRLCVRWGPSPSPPKGVEPLIFGLRLVWPNGFINQDATWYGGRPRLRDIVLDGDPAPLP